MQCTCFPHDNSKYTSNSWLLVDFGGLSRQKKLTNLEPRCLLEHKERNNETKEQTIRSCISWRQTTVYLCCRSSRTAAVGILNLAITTQPDEPATHGQRQDRFQCQVITDWLTQVFSSDLKYTWFRTKSTNWCMAELVKIRNEFQTCSVTLIQNGHSICEIAWQRVSTAIKRRSFNCIYP